MKGHTHEDCDQLFSRFGLKLGTNDVVTVDGMLIISFLVFMPRQTLQGFMQCNINWLSMANIKYFNLM